MKEYHKLKVHKNHQHQKIMEFYQIPKSFNLHKNFLWYNNLKLSMIILLKKKMKEIILKFLIQVSI